MDQSEESIHDLRFKNGELTQHAADAIDKWQTLHEYYEGLSKDMESAKAESHDLCLVHTSRVKMLLKQRQREEIAEGVAELNLGSRLEANFRVVECISNAEGYCSE